MCSSDLPASTEIQNHDACDHELEVARKRYEFELVVEFRNEFRGAGECDARYEDETPVHALVLADRFAERTALVVDCEGGDLLDKLEKVDGRVE